MICKIWWLLFLCEEGDHFDHALTIDDSGNGRLIEAFLLRILLSVLYRVNMV